MARSCALLVLLCSLTAAAQSAPDTMHHYFEGEMNERWAFGGLGVASIGTGLGLAAAGRPATVGASLPLFAVGAIQLALGVGLWIRTPGQVAALDAQLAADPHGYLEAERTRMARVNRGFGIYKVIETTLFFAGAGLAGIGGISGTDSMLGAGFSLAAEALAMLLLDLFADARGKAYESALLGFRF